MGASLRGVAAPPPTPPKSEVQTSHTVHKPQEKEQVSTMPATSSTAPASSSDKKVENAGEEKKIAGFGNTNDPKNVCDAQWLLLWTHAAYCPEKPYISPRN